MANVTTPLVLRITRPTVLKRRIAPLDQLTVSETVDKGPCRIPLESYAESVPGENLQNHFKIFLAGPYKGSSVWYVPKEHSLIEGTENSPAPMPEKPPLVLRITKPTLLKRRPVPAEALAANEKVAKPPCRIFLHSYVYEVPGENLQGHLKVCFEGPILNNASVWYIYKGHCLIEGVEPPQPPPPTSGTSGKINRAGLDMIKHFEGFRPQAYICPAGVPTIGYGSTLGVRMGDRITQQGGEDLLQRDLVRFERAVSDAVKVPLTSNQFSALVCFAFNVGIGAFQRSTLLKLLNQRNYQGAADQLLLWNKGGGRVLQGLVRRREAERALFLKRN
ncbi:lysozyme [Leptolyngbya sp. FACHB-541]|uniref:lysozyme n=1 Tax=Leptolyngbya sp. FACHB-541 TaxID=2692810 RepID=UPI0018F0071B|nr:lysozyme [Leptolyngbya sp. FACHB-541]